MNLRNGSYLLSIIFRLRSLKSNFAVAPSGVPALVEGGPAAAVLSVCYLVNNFVPILAGWFYPLTFYLVDFEPHSKFVRTSRPLHGRGPSTFNHSTAALPPSRRGPEHQRGASLGHVLASCLRGSRHNSAPEERYNLAHGVSRGVRVHPPTPLPLSRPRGRGVPKAG